MKNGEIFKIFREHVDPSLSQLGFVPLRNTSTNVPWCRKLKNRRHETTWCQLDKWPWDVWIGTQFTVNFQVSKKAGIGLSPGTKFARIGDLLKGKSKKEAERIHNAAINKIKVPTAEEYNREVGAEFAENDDDFVLDEYREKSRPVNFGRRLGDIWLRIVDRDDADEWAKFLAAWLPTGLECFEKLEGDEYIY